MLVSWAVEAVLDGNTLFLFDSFLTKDLPEKLSGSFQLEVFAFAQIRKPDTRPFFMHRWVGVLVFSCRDALSCKNWAQIAKILAIVTQLLGPCHGPAAVPSNVTFAPLCCHRAIDISTSTPLLAVPDAQRNFGN